MARPKGGRGRCIICGKETISPDYRDVPIYCEEHRAYADKDDEILKTAPKELLFFLIRGIFIRARIDYMTNADGMKTDAEVFFRSLWAQDLSLSEFDATEVLKQMDEDIEDGLYTDYEDFE